MENQEKTMRPIPKNVRQIGERDEEIKLYIEDYVNTFIRKCARMDRLVVGALIGDYYISEGKEYLFVEGAVQAENFTVSDGRVRMTDESWSGLYGKISEFFSGKSICGWFLCSGDSECCSEGMVRGFMYENIGQDKRALVIHNGEAEEESFSVYDQNVIREQQGYYLFYERNEAMQSYMVTTSLAVRTDPVAVDSVTASVRTRMVEKKEAPVQKGGYSFVSAAALVVGVIALASGIVMMNHYDRLREMEAVLTGLTGDLLNAGQESSGESAGGTEPVFGGLIIEDVNGDVSPTETSADMTEGQTDGSIQTGETPSPDMNESQTGEDISQSGSEDDKSGGAPVDASAATENSETENQTEDSDKESDAEEAGAAQYRTYLVEKGDTLVTICWRVYGYRDDEIIQQICEINKLSDKDHIYAGQELLIP